MAMKFESFVNSERCKTSPPPAVSSVLFESFVNSERCKTSVPRVVRTCQFESFVNSERCKTGMGADAEYICLRALLIQKDVKHMYQ